MVSSLDGAGYVKNPDMIAFTIGRLVCSKVSSGRVISMDALLMRLQQISSGESDYCPEGISPQMAAAALQYLVAAASRAA